MKKKLHVLENDYRCPASDEDIRQLKRRLKYCGVPVEDINDIEIHYQFGLETNEDAYKIIFNPDNILVTNSVYISGSDSQMLFFLEAAGRNGIKDIVYIDTSGALPEFLNGNLRNADNVFDIACGINTNYILSYDYETDSVKRLKFCPKGKWDDCLELEDFDINQVL
jgi:hypothetical protein